MKNIFFLNNEVLKNFIYKNNTDILPTTESMEKTQQVLSNALNRYGYQLTEGTSLCRYSGSDIYYLNNPKYNIDDYSITTDAGTSYHIPKIKLGFDLKGKPIQEGVTMHDLFTPIDRIKDLSLLIKGWLHLGLIKEMPIEIKNIYQDVYNNSKIARRTIPLGNSLSKNILKLHNEFNELDQIFSELKKRKKQIEKDIKFLKNTTSSSDDTYECYTNNNQYGIYVTNKKLYKIQNIAARNLELDESEKFIDMTTNYKSDNKSTVKDLYKNMPKLLESKLSTVNQKIAKIKKEISKKNKQIEKAIDEEKNNSNDVISV